MMHAWLLHAKSSAGAQHAPPRWLLLHLSSLCLVGGDSRGSQPACKLIARRRGVQLLRPVSSDVGGRRGWLSLLLLFLEGLCEGLVEPLTQ